MNISTEERFWSKVDRSAGVDECWLWTRGTTKGDYGNFYVDGHQVGAHRFAYECVVGPIPSGHDLDHRVTCPKRCVNPTHLRPVTNKQNHENRAGARRDSKSGVRGVTKACRGQKWEARVGHNSKIIRVGYFDTIEEAEAAVIAKRLELFTHNDLDRVESP